TAVALSITDQWLDWVKKAAGFATSSEQDAQGKKQFLSQIASIIGARGRAEGISRDVGIIGQHSDPGCLRGSLNGLRSGLQQGAGPTTLSKGGQGELMQLIRGAESPAQTAALDLAEYITMVDSPTLRAAVSQAKNNVL